MTYFGRRGAGHTAAGMGERIGEGEGTAKSGWKGSTRLMGYIAVHAGTWQRWELGSDERIGAAVSREEKWPSKENTTTMEDERDGIGGRRRLTGGASESRGMWGRRARAGGGLGGEGEFMKEWRA